MDNHHLKKSIGSGKELAHDNLEELLALKVFLVTGELDVELLKQGRNLVFLKVHDSRKDFEDRIKDKLIESALEMLTLMFARFGPFLRLWIEVVVALENLSVLCQIRKT